MATLAGSRAAVSSRVANWLSRHVFARRAWLRLEAALILENHAYPPEAGTPRAALLSEAFKALGDGRRDLGWQCLLALQRLRLPTSPGTALNAEAEAIRKEAETKLGGWRKAAVVELLTPPQNGSVAPDKLRKAVELRDEHFTNEAYRAGLRRSTALQLATVLAGVLVLLLLLAWSGFLGNAIWTAQSSVPPVPEFWPALAVVALFGLLGATFSAILDAPVEKGTRIPEITATIRVTLLRILIGPASAIFMLVVVRSGLYESIFKPALKPEGYSLLVIAFAAGFTERLVMRVVGAIASEPKKDSST